MAKRKLSTIQQVEANRAFLAAHPLSRITIKYDRYSKDYSYFVDGEYLGSVGTYAMAEIIATNYVTKQTEMEAARPVVVEEPEVEVADNMAQAAQLCALVDDGDILAAIHTYSVTQDVPALKAEIQKLIASNTLVDTAERYTQYIRNVNGVVRLTSFIVSNWMAIANEEVGIPF